MSDIPSTDSDPQELYESLRTLARSRTDTDMQVLSQRLINAAVLDRLDDAEAYDGPVQRLRIAGVLQALGANESPAAQSLISWLTTAPAFVAEPARVELLIRLLANVRPPTPEGLAFWQRFSQPDDGFSNITVSALVTNGTSEAVALFEQIFRNPAHPEEDRFTWLVIDVLTHRNDLPLLQSCERLLQGPNDEADRLLLVDVLFDYQPEEWYRPAAWPDAPDRAAAQGEALQVLRRIGVWALGNMPLTDAQRATVQGVVDGIEQPR